MDEILMQEAREQLESQGLDDETIDFIIEDMADEGMFDVDTDHWT